MGLPDRELSDGDLADVPGWRLRAVHTPGHTPGHLCFVDELSQRLFAGDHILPRITPNISLHAVERVHPLADYLDSLAKVRDLDVDEIMPAHEWRFRGLAERADDIAAHHERRLAELLAAIAAHPGETSWFLAGPAHLVPVVGPVQRPDADQRGHRDGRARARAGQARAGERQRRRRADLPGRRARRRLTVASNLRTLHVARGRAKRA